MGSDDAASHWLVDVLNSSTVARAVQLALCPPATSSHMSYMSTAGL